MNTEKIQLTFKGKLEVLMVAQITRIFGTYNINIIDLQMDNINYDSGSLIVIFNASSTTDEIDSFWNEIKQISKDLHLEYSNKYLT
jgi:predicted amino acid-binding ACT domain protein